MNTPALLLSSSSLLQAAPAALASPELVEWADAAVKSAALLLLATLAAPLLRKTSAATRHTLWAGALAAALQLPLLSLALPSWRVPWLPAWPSTDRSPLREQRDAAPSASPEPVERASPELAASRELVESVERTILRDEGVAAPSNPPPAKPHSAIHPPQSEISVLPSPSSILLLYLAGLALSLLPLLAGWLQAARLTRRARPPTAPEWAALLADTSRSLGFRARVRLLLAPGATMPFTWGVLRPAVVLPESAEAWPESRRRLVLLHELGHVRRHDWLTQTLAALACALHWFNPLAWLAARQLRLEREQACDDLVLACGQPPKDYARELLALAALSARGRLLALATVPMARPSALEARLRAILDGQRRRTPLPRAAALALAALLSVIAIPLAMLRGAAEMVNPSSSSSLSLSSTGKTPPSGIPSSDSKMLVTQFEGFVEYGGPNVTVAGDSAQSAPSGFFQPVFSVREIAAKTETGNAKNVPLLGDIPLIGRLFQPKGETAEKIAPDQTTPPTAPFTPKASAPSPTASPPDVQSPAAPAPAAKSERGVNAAGMLAAVTGNWSPPSVVAAGASVTASMSAPNLGGLVTEIFPISYPAVHTILAAELKLPVADLATAKAFASDPLGIELTGQVIRAFLQRAGADFAGTPDSKLIYDGAAIIVMQTARNIERIREILSRYNTVMQVTIETRFIEVPEAQLAGVLTGLKFISNPVAGADNDATGAVRHIETAAASVWLRQLERLPGVELLSSPSVTVLSGNPANISVGEEPRYVTTSAASPAAPPEKTTKIIVGVELAAKATVAEDRSSIALEVRPRLTEAAGTVRLPAKGGVPDPNDVLPIFVTRELAGKVTVKDGETVVFGVLPLKSVRVGHDNITNPAMLGREIQDKLAALPARNVLVLVTVNLVGPGGRGQSGNRAKFVVPAVPVPPAP